MTQEQAYATWWWEEGSGILPLPTEDMEEFAHRITQIAWSNAVYKEREACATILEATDLSGIKDNPSMQKWVANMLLAYANAIRARGQA